MKNVDSHQESLRILGKNDGFDMVQLVANIRSSEAHANASDLSRFDTMSHVIMIQDGISHKNYHAFHDTHNLIIN